MEGFVFAVRAVCFASAGICIVRCITDGTKLRGQADFVLKLIFAVVVVSPIVNGVFNIKLPDLSAFDCKDYSYSSEIYWPATGSTSCRSTNRPLLAGIHDTP